MSKSSSLRSWLEIPLLAALAFVFSQTAGGFVSIPSGSMQPTLNPGDYLVVNRLAYGLHVPFTVDKEVARWSLPQRGDIVIFNVPAKARESEALFIKRVVGLPGDTVEVKDDHLIVNGARLDYRAGADGVERERLGSAEHRVLTGPGPLANQAPLTVPAGHIFVMGDHRNNSADSRAWGPLPLERLRGRAVFRVYGSESSFTLLD